MTSANELLHELRRRGATLTPNGDKLRITAPRGVITPHLLDQINRHKPALLQLLNTNAGDVDHDLALEEPATFGEVWSGFTAEAWVEELRRKAARCDLYRPC